MDKDQIEALPRKHGMYVVFHLRGKEIAERRWHRRWQSRDHAEHLHRIVHLGHHEFRAIRRNPGAFARLRRRPHKRNDVQFVLAGQMPNHVERPNLAAALWRKRKAVA
jgi:hypothetical protein